MILKCKECGSIYNGGIICEKCGTAYDEEEVKKFLKEQELSEKENKKTLSIVLFLVAAVVCFMVISVFTAIFIPAFIGYNKRAKETARRYSEEYSITEQNNETEEYGVDINEYMKKYGVFKSGTYECGKDVPEGEYIIIADDDIYGDFYCGVYTKSSCSDDSELYGDWYQGNMYVYLKEGQFIDFSWGTMYSLDTADSKGIFCDNNFYGAMYKVGRDIDAGKYYIKSTDEQYSYHYTIYSSIDSIIPVTKLDIFEEENYYNDGEKIVELNDGEYISIRFGKLEKAE